jgi:ABC-type lipoprotein export system ATPase subunit
MFAGKLGLLSLDEPTAYLDDSNVDRFGILLTKVKEIARNMNTQVLMATHERAVIPYMDSVIDLN